MQKPKRQKDSVTIIDVAKAAGVGRMTVSRFFSSPEKVSAKTRDRISKIVDDLGYAPSPAARALASKRSDIVGVVIPSITNSVFSDVLKGIYGALNDTIFRVQIGNFQYDPKEEEKVVRSFLLQNPAGMIVTGVDQSALCREMLKRAECPVVQIMELTDDPIDMVVGLDHANAVTAALSHFLEQGFRYPAFLAGRQDPRVLRRRKAFEEFCHSRGIFSNGRVLTSSDHSSTSLGRVFLNKLLIQAPDTDCIFCNNDDIALGVLFECQRKGMKVPKELAICGFNDLEVAENTFPRLSSIHTNRMEMGSKAAEILVSAIGGDKNGPQKIDIGFELRARESSLKH